MAHRTGTDRAVSPGRPSLSALPASLPFAATSRTGQGCFPLAELPTPPALKGLLPEVDRPGCLVGASLRRDYSTHSILPRQIQRRGIDAAPFPATPSPVTMLRKPGPVLPLTPFPEERELADSATSM